MADNTENKETETPANAPKMPDEMIEKLRQLRKERMEKAESEKDDELGGAATAEESKEAKPAARSVTFEGFVKLEIYNGEELVETLNPERNIISICETLKSVNKDRTVSIYAVVDRAHSDPVPEGSEDPAYPILGIEKKPIEEAFRTLVQNLVPEQYCMLEFQRLCEFMSFRSSLQAALMTFVFKGSQPGGFSYFSPCSTVEDKDRTVLYSATMSQAKMYKDKIKEKFPLIRFEDDSGIIVPR